MTDSPFDLIATALAADPDLREDVIGAVFNEHGFDDAEAVRAALIPPAPAPDPVPQRTHVLYELWRGDRLMQQELVDQRFRVAMFPPKVVVHASNYPAGYRWHVVLPDGTEHWVDAEGP